MKKRAKINRKRTTRNDARGDYIATRQVQVARWFGVSLATVRFWSTAGMPGRPGHYDLAEISRWRIAQLDRQAGTARDDDDAKRKLNEIKARSAEIDLQVKERSYVPLHYAREIVDDFFRAMTTARSTLSQRYGGQADETMSMCLAEMREARAKFDRDLTVC